MNESKEQKCPECGSKNVLETGIKSDNIGAQDFPVDQEKIRDNVYECQDCKKLFILNL